MAIPDSLAKGIRPSSSDDGDAPDADMDADQTTDAPGAHGRLILKAIADKDAVALEEAIKACVADTTY